MASGLSWGRSKVHNGKILELVSKEEQRMKKVSFLVGFFALASLSFGSSFSECPAVGNDTSGCELLITVTAVNGSGAVTAFTTATSSPDLGPYDGSEDTLIG